jgi:ribosomal protein S18 acetylase RimI-like enzyme
MSSPAIVSVEQDRLDDLKPLWAALYDHHRAIAPQLRDREVPFDQAWEARQQIERQWLRTEPGSFVMAVRTPGGFVGYALVRIRSGAELTTSWRFSDPIAELATLAVLPAFRCQGLGSALMDAVEDRLRALDIADLVIGVIATNVEATRFYERRGAVPFHTELIQRVG